MDEKNALLKQLLHLKNYKGDENGEDGDLDFAALFGAVETETKSYAEYADRSIKLGKDLLNLYAKHKEGDTEELVQLEEQAQFTLNVVQKLKNVVLPIIKPCSDVVGELKANINGHDERVQELLQAMESTHTKLKFGEHSDYVHWMIAHAKDDCLRVINRFGVHLSAFSCQTSEHFNKVLKRSVKRYHDFST